MTLTNTKIGFIGAGNMATALIEGLLANALAPDLLHASDTHAERLSALKTLGIHTMTDNVALVESCDIVVLAVKPQIMESVLQGISQSLQNHSCLLISIAAGIQLASLQAWSHPGQALVRCMPNTPALVKAGASALFANAQVSAAQKAAAANILEAVGMSCWLDNESQLDAVTALSGSGPAYFFLLMEAMQSAAESLGLPSDIARSLCLQTAFGAAKLAQASDVDVAELRRRVTSPGGTTEAAIRHFESAGFQALVHAALEKAAQRAQALAKQ